MKVFRISCCFIALMASGCNNTTKQTISSNLPEPEIISGYDYEYFCGHNAAVAQFGSEYTDLFVDLNNKKVATYVNDSDRVGYADGYHKALDIISNRNNPKCPDLH